MPDPAPHHHAPPAPSWLHRDTVVRFAPLQLPAGFYADFARVADDEARHFGWCCQRLAELGHSYGDMVAHDLLWQGCEISAGDLTARCVMGLN